MGLCSRFPGILLVLAGLVATTAGAQDRALDLGLNYIFDGGEGIKSQCYGRSYALGIGASVAVPILGKVLTAAAAGRVYPIGRGPTCAIDAFVPQDGTFTTDDRVTLQATRFLTSDLRLQVQPVGRLTVAVGGGMAWHPGQDLPYLVGATTVRFPPRRRLQVSIGAELYWLRSAWNTWSVTYANAVPVATVPLGRRHEWTWALALGVSARLTM